MKGPALLIFLRKLELGMVKTRLAASVGDERALHVYRRLTAHTLRIAASFTGSRQAWFANEPDGSEVVPGCSIHQQCEGDLGERMLHALESAASAGNTPLFIIGTDCPGLSVELLQDALNALKEHDVVIGPAEDGGYYLLGMNSVHPDLFRNKPWSTETVAALTIKDLRASGSTFHLLPTLVDVDTVEDLRLFPELLAVE